jgi:hypothetical protein
MSSERGQRGQRGAQSYRLSSHMAQPATITPPTNIAKQYSP